MQCIVSIKWLPWSLCSLRWSWKCMAPTAQELSSCRMCFQPSVGSCLLLGDSSSPAALVCFSAPSVPIRLPVTRRPCARGFWQKLREWEWQNEGEIEGGKWCGMRSCSTRQGVNVGWCGEHVWTCCGVTRGCGPEGLRYCCLWTEGNGASGAHAEPCHCVCLLLSHRYSSVPTALLDHRFVHCLRKAVWAASVAAGSCLSTPGI